MREVTSEEPVLPIFAVMTPVETVIDPPLFLTVTLWAAVAGSPVVRVNFLAPPASGPTACAVHFREPSGHLAVAQVWTGTSLPSAVARANFWSAG